MYRFLIDAVALSFNLLTLNQRCLLSNHHLPYGQQCQSQSSNKAPSPSLWDTYLYIWEFHRKTIVTLAIPGFLVTFSAPTTPDLLIPSMMQMWQSQQCVDCGCSLAEFVQQSRNMSPLTPVSFPDNTRCLVGLI